MVRVNVGCGTTPTTGWRNFDNSPSLKLARVPLLPSLLFRAGLLRKRQYQFAQFARENAIEFGDVAKGLPLPAGSADILYSSHMLEHLDRAEADVFLKEARRVLRSGGTIRLVVPDLRKLVDRYVDSGNADEFLKVSHLTQPRPRALTQRLRILLTGTRHHQWLYDGPSLTRLLAAHGFLDPRALEAGQSRIEKPEPLDLFERADDSVFVEATNP